MNIELQTAKTLELLSKEFSLSKNEICREGVKYFLEKKLREIKTEIFEIAGKYNISSIKGMDELYKKGEIEEKDSWADFQKLDHLEFKKDEIEKFIKGLE